MTPGVLHGSCDHRGGLDAFFAKAKDEELSTRALKIKRDIAKSTDTAAALQR